MDERRTTRVQFQEAESAVEYCETHYYKNPNIYSNLIGDNTFWSDLATHIVETGSIDGFLSSSLMFACQNKTE